MVKQILGKNQLKVQFFLLAPSNKTQPQVHVINNKNNLKLYI